MIGEVKVMVEFGLGDGENLVIGVSSERCSGFGAVGNGGGDSVCTLKANSY